MAKKKGEAGRALGAALMSSLVGAIFGALALTLAIPAVRPLVLTFGSPEFFMLAVLGVAFVASLSGENLLKGLIGGGIGYLLATIGLDPISGIQRYTFGQLFLWDGIGLVPVTIGLFAIPEIIDLAVQGTSIAKQQPTALGGVMQGVRDTFIHFWMVIRCSAIGTYIGLIPGIGGAVSQWVAYAHAVQSSPDKERFGKGAVEGVLGPGAANNSTLGGALIPTVAFGVPGSVSTAILLGAFIIQGIVPGPDMLIPEPKGHPTVTFSLVWINIVSNLITVEICFLFLDKLAKITNIRANLLMPFILLLVYLGTFAEKNAFEDLGVLGWVMVKLDWQRPPLILGLVLGPVMGNRLFLSTDNYGATWLWRPGVLILLAITLGGLLYPALKKKFKIKKQTETPGAIPAPVIEAKIADWSVWSILFSVARGRSGTGPVGEQKLRLSRRLVSVGDRDSRADSLRHATSHGHHGQDARQRARRPRCRRRAAQRGCLAPDNSDHDLDWCLLFRHMAFGFYPFCPFDCVSPSVAGERGEKISVPHAGSGRLGLFLLFVRLFLSSAVPGRLALFPVPVKRSLAVRKNGACERDKSMVLFENERVSVGARFNSGLAPKRRQPGLLFARQTRRAIVMGDLRESRSGH